MMRKLLSIMTIAVVVLSVLSCKSGAHDGGPSETKDFNVKPFTSIAIKGGVSLEYVQDDSLKVKVTASREKMKHFKIEQEGDKIILDSEYIDGNESSGEDVKVFIQSPDIHNINVDGAADIRMKKPIKVDNLNIVIDGAGAVSLDDICATNQLTIETNGAAAAKVNANHCGTINAIINGTGAIKIKGTAHALNQKIAGIGVISDSGLEIIP